MSNTLPITVPSSLQPHYGGGAGGIAYRLPRLSRWRQEAKASVLGAAYLRQIGLAPQSKAPESLRNPGKFQTAGWDMGMAD